MRHYCILSFHCFLPSQKHINSANIFGNKEQCIMPVKTMKTHKVLSFSCVLSLHVQTTECPSKGFQPVFFTFYFLSSENCKVKKNQIPHRSTLRSQGLVSCAFSLWTSLSSRWPDRCLVFSLSRHTYMSCNGEGSPADSRQAVWWLTLDLNARVLERGDCASPYACDVMIYTIPQLSVKESAFPLMLMFENVFKSGLMCL